MRTVLLCLLLAGCSAPKKSEPVPAAPIEKPLEKPKIPASVVIVDEAAPVLNGKGGPNAGAQPPWTPSGNMTTPYTMYPGPSGRSVCAGEDTLAGQNGELTWAEGSIPAHGTIILEPELYLCDIESGWGGQGNAVLYVQLYAKGGKNPYDGLEIHLIGPSNKPSNYFDVCPRDRPSVPFRGMIAVAVPGTHNPDGDAHGWSNTLPAPTGAGCGGKYHAVLKETAGKDRKGLKASMKWVGASQHGVYPPEYDFGPTAWTAALVAKEQEP